jgi:hypothetical protein
MSTQYASRVPLLTAWLLSNVPSALSLDAAQVVDGPPTEANLRATCVVFGDVEHEEGWAALGARNRDEVVSIKSCIYVLGAGQTQTAVNSTAYSLQSTLDLYLRANITAIATAAPGIWDVATRRTALAKSMGDQARMAYLAFDVRFQARI